nr:N-acetylglucosaminylphosphatidylinositol deacetylase [Trypanosoma brucei]
MHGALAFGFVVVFLSFLVLWQRASCVSKIHLVGDVLFVFAHPDDEAMFFSPLLDYVRRHGLNAHFLCLSNGNYSGLGTVREKELVASAEYFGVNRRSVRVVDHPDLQDGPDNLWNTEIVQREVLSYLHSVKDIRTVITFDHRGVSSHANHVAVYEGVLLAKKNLPPGILFLSLHTRDLLEKYVGILSTVGYTVGIHRCGGRRNHVILIPPTSLFTSFSAMRKHKTQLVWFRYLFVWFSSYSYVNEVKELGVA